MQRSARLFAAKATTFAVGSAHISRPTGGRSNDGIRAQPADRRSPFRRCGGLGTDWSGTGQMRLRSPVAAPSSGRRSCHAECRARGVTSFAWARDGRGRPRGALNRDDAGGRSRRSASQGRPRRAAVLLRAASSVSLSPPTSWPRAKLAMAACRAATSAASLLDLALLRCPEVLVAEPRHLRPTWRSRPARWCASADPRPSS